MTQFHEGQEVDVLQPINHPIEGYPGTYWRKAKIVGWTACRNQTPRYEVQFHDGARAMLDAAYIRAIEPSEEYPGLAEPDDDTSDPMGSVATP